MEILKLNAIEQFIEVDRMLNYNIVEQCAIENWRKLFGYNKPKLVPFIGSFSSPFSIVIVLSFKLVATHTHTPEILKSFTSNTCETFRMHIEQWFKFGNSFEFCIFKQRKHLNLNKLIDN